MWTPWIAKTKTKTTTFICIFQSTVLSRRGERETGFDFVPCDPIAVLALINAHLIQEDLFLHNYRCVPLSYHFSTYSNHKSLPGEECKLIITIHTWLTKQEVKTQSITRKVQDFDSHSIQSGRDQEECYCLAPVTYKGLGSITAYHIIQLCI